MATLAASISRGCLWDSDTIYDELAGKLNLQNAIAGRIARNPAKYYELRLRNVREKLKVNPNDAGSYDDAAVACDRLGRYDEAIRWMRLKRKRGFSGAATQYRTEANEGTMIFHRWLSRGRLNSELAEAKVGRDMIARAITLNPDAHFGRERVQLVAMNWVIAMVEQPLRKPHPLVDEFRLHRDIGWEKQQEGLIGLMALGNAWESVDVIDALNPRIRGQSMQALITLRIRELEREGKRSLTGKVLRPEPPDSVGSVQLAIVVDNFRAMRKNANAFQARRQEFMISKLGKGQHPDTHPDFWHGYREIPPYKIPSPWPWTRLMVWATTPGNGGFVFTVIAALIATSIYFYVNRGKPRQVLRRQVPRKG